MKEGRKGRKKEGGEGGREKNIFGAKAVLQVCGRQVRLGRRVFGITGEDTKCINWNAFFSLQTVNNYRRQVCQGKSAGHMVLFCLHATFLCSSRVQRN